MKRKLIIAAAGIAAIVVGVIGVAGRAGAERPAWRTHGQLVMHSNGLINTGVAMSVVFHAPAATRGQR